MTGTWKSKISKTHLFDIAQALKDQGIDHRPFFI
jgi:hypothetical protein